MICHPRWTGSFHSGYDVALIRLPRALKTQVPLLAGRPFDMYPNMKAHGFKLAGALRVAQFEVVANPMCPNLSDLSSKMFCAYSKVAKLEPGRHAEPQYSVINPEEFGRHLQ